MFVFVCVMGDLGVVIMVEREKKYRETNVKNGMFVYKCCNFVT